MHHWVNQAVSLPRKTKITDLSDTVLINEHIGRFQISVNDAGGVDEMKSAEQVIHDGLNVVLSKFYALIHHAEQVCLLSFEDIVKIRE